MTLSSIQVVRMSLIAGCVACLASVAAAFDSPELALQSDGWNQEPAVSSQVEKSIAVYSGKSRITIRSNDAGQPAQSLTRFHEQPKPAKPMPIGQPTNALAYATGQDATRNSGPIVLMAAEPRVAARNARNNASDDKRYYVLVSDEIPVTPSDAPNFPRSETVDDGQRVAILERAAGDGVQRLATLINGAPVSTAPEDAIRGPQVDQYVSLSPEEDAPAKTSTCCQGTPSCGCAKCNAAPSCGSQACGCELDSNCDRGCCCGPKLFIAGAEATFLAPDFSRSHNVRIITGDLALATQTDYNGDDANVDGMTVGPRVWLGYQYECWGFQTRFWQLANNRQEQAGIVQGNYALADSNLEVYTLDFELTRRLATCCENVMFSFGVRNANIDNNGALSIVESTSTGSLLRATASAGNEFNGTGITFGVQGLRPIGSGHLNLFWKARGSVLWGESTARADTFGAYNSNLAASVRGDHAIDVSDDDLFIGELQAGLQWDYPLECLPASAFFRVAFEYQYWDTGTGQAGTLSTVGAIGDAGVASAAEADGLRMNLYGFSIGTGLYW